MRYLLTLMLIVLAASDALKLDLSLAPGLSAKNALSYVALLMLVLRIIIRREFKFELPSLTLGFAILIAYAVLSFIVIVTIIHYPRYEIFASVLILKQLLGDSAIFFFVFFYGLESTADAKYMTKVLLLAIAGANAISLLDVSGVVSLGVTTVGSSGAEADRVFGPFGHANETAALIICLLPAYFAAASKSSGYGKLIWIGSGFVSATMFVLTGSRGGLVGIVVGYLWAAYLTRKVLPKKALGNFMKWAAVAAFIAVPIFAVLEMKFGSVLLQRITSYDPSEGGSGRTYIWRTAIERMMDHPLSLITGFGWNAYSTMGFIFVMHNHYLWLWFELGLVGVITYILMIRNSLATAKSVARGVDEETRAYLIAYIFGMISMSVAIFFVLLGLPWPYIWAYVGTTMRLAVSAKTIPVTVKAKAILPRK